MTIINKKLSEIKPYEKNAKKHPEKQIANIAESIKQYGFVQPIVIDADGVIVIGHGRALAAKQLGIKEVPCVLVDDLTPEQVKALRLVDNKTNESAWDFDLLMSELPELDLTGFDLDFVGKSYIDDLLDEEMTDLKTKEKITEFSVTFLFSLQHEDLIKNAIAKVGKQPFIEAMLEVARNVD